MEHKTILPTIAEYFAGIGLVRMGLEPFGWQVVFANDISSKKFEMYKTFFPDAKNHYVVGDVFNLDAAKIPNATLATCSFPCIDLSLAGNMNGIMNGNHSSAFWGFISVLKQQAIRAPRFVLIENVPGWLYSNKGQDFRVTVQALNELGYACDVFTLDARRFTPQSRLRVFLIGAKIEIAATSPELILTRPRSLLTEQAQKCVTQNKNLYWFYNEIPYPPPLNANGLSKIIEPMSDSDARWWDENQVKRHLAMMKKEHLERVLKLAQDDQFSYRTFFRRRREGQQRAEVRDDDLSGCLRTAVGGSGKQFLVRAGNNSIKMRAMTAREYARLQGVPDKYPIRANGVQALTGFGDAVCVPVISWIAENVLNPLVHVQSVPLQREVMNSQPFLLEHGGQFKP